MPVLFDSASRRNPSTFGSGVYRMPEHTPTPLADILAAHRAHPARVTKFRPARPFTSTDTAWDLGYRLATEHPGALPPSNYDETLRNAFLAGADAALRAN